MYTTSMRMRQIIVQRQQHHKREKHAYRTQKMPNIMIIVKSQQRATLIEMSRLCRCFRPRNRFIQKEIHRRNRAHCRKQ